MHLLCTYMFLNSTFIKKNTCMQLHMQLVYVITFIITLLTHPLHLNPTLNLPIPPNLSLILTVSLLNSSKSILQYNMKTIGTLYFFFYITA